MAVGDVYQSDIWFSLQGDDVNIYTYHLKEVSAPGVLKSEDDINAQLALSLVPAFVMSQSDQVEFTCIETKKIFDIPQLATVTSVGRQLALTGQVGTLLTNSLPAQCSLCVQLLSDLDLANPSSRGRDFYTGFTCDDTLNGEWLVSTVDTWQNGLANTFFPTMQTLDGGEYEWVVYSSKLANQDPTLADPTSQINHLRSLKQVRTQRRRQPTNVCDKYFQIKDRV